MLGALGTASPAHAEDEGLDALLDEHVVTGASKADELAKVAPATTSVITAEDMNRYGIRSDSSRGDRFSGHGPRYPNSLHSVEVGGRGVLLTSDFGNHVLLVVDGHVFNEPWGGTAYFEQGAGIPIEMIDHIELVLGPGSVLYGGNAMIGVINVVTKRGAAFNGLHLVAAGGLSPEQGRNGNFTSFAPGDLGGSYRLGASLGQQLPFLGPNAEIDAGVELYAQNGPSFRNGVRRSSTTTTGTPRNFGPRTPPGVWGGRIRDQYSTLVPTFYSRMQVGDLAIMFRTELYRRGTPVQGFDQQNTDFDEPRSWERDRWISLDVQYQKRVSQKLSLSFRGYGDAYDYYQQTYNTDSTVCAVPTTGPCLFTGKGHSRWLGSEIQASFDWTGEDRYSTLVGLNGTVRDVGGETDSVEANTGALLDATGKKSVVEVVKAAYLQQRLSPTKIPTLQRRRALRRRSRAAAPGSRPARRSRSTCGMAEVLKLIYAEAFRPPTFFEALYSVASTKSNPSIKSEYVRGAEATFEQRFGRNKLLFGVFRTQWSDMLAIETLPSGVSQYQNVSEINNYGYNARLEGVVGALRYGASIVGAYTRREPDDQPLPVAPQIFGNARLAYALPGSLPVVALATTSVGEPTPPTAFWTATSRHRRTHLPSAEIRLTLSQPGSARCRASRTGVSGTSYTTGSVVPYVAGPIQAYDPAATARGPAELTPVVKLLVFATLRYDVNL